MTNDYPEHEKLAKISDQSQMIGEFLDWLSAEGYHLARWVEDDGSDWLAQEDGHLMNVGWRIQDRLADYFGIDPDKLEAEKRAMLDEMSQLNQDLDEIEASE